MKQTISLGAYGWRHDHWNVSFYPDDMPIDWRLSYYSNEFECVLVPRHYWSPGSGYDCVNWPDDVHENFAFYLELPDCVAVDDAEFELFSQQVSHLLPQLSAILINRPSDKNLFHGCLPDGINLLLLDEVRDPWVYRDHSGSGKVLFIHDDLLDLRKTRQALESALQQENDVKALLVGSDSCEKNRSDLQADNLFKLRGVMDILGL